jgi:hypothetical protein
MEPLREITGYIAHALLAAYWAWTLCCTAPQLRKGRRDRSLRLRVLLVKSAGIVLTALLVGVIHFWATALWQIGVAIPVAAVLGYLLRRSYRKLVQAPRHRLTLVARVRRGRTDPVADVDVELPLRVVPLPAVPAPLADVVLPPAEPAREPVTTTPADPAPADVDAASVPAQRGPDTLATVALPEPGRAAAGPETGPEIDVVLVDRIRRQSRVAARGSLEPLRR